MIEQYFDSATRLTSECLDNHPLCREFYASHFGSTKIEDYDPNLRKQYTGNNLVITTALGASLPSPDGLEWSEFHHIHGRAHSGVGRLISHELHSRAHSHGLEIKVPEVIFHCINPAINWAQLYLDGRSAVIPDRPVEQLWMLRIAHEYHSNDGNEIHSAVQLLDTHTSMSIHSYIWSIRIESWSEDGTTQKNNVCPSLYPSIYREWSEDIKAQLKTWYSMTARQKQYTNHLSCLAGHLGTNLFRNGLSTSAVRRLTSTFRMAEAIYRIASDIFENSADTEEDVGRLIVLLENTSSLADSDRAKSILNSWFTVENVSREQNELAEQGSRFVRKGYYTQDTIFLLISMQNTEDNFAAASNIYQMQALESNVLELSEWE